MENTEIIMAMVAGLGVVMMWAWKGIDNRFDKIDQRFEKIDQRFDKLDEKVTDIDRRLCRLEGAFSKQECCMLKEHKHAAGE